MLAHNDNANSKAMPKPSTTMIRKDQNSGATFGTESCAALSIISGVALLTSLV
jgi:hypothetical protein